MDRVARPLIRNAYLSPAVAAIGAKSSLTLIVLSFIQPSLLGTSCSVPSIPTFEVPNPIREPHMSKYCQRCNLSFPDECAHAQHVADSNRHHVCHECPKDFASAQALSEHTRQKHAAARRSLRCGTCKEVFPSVRALQGHLHSKVCEPRKLLLCPAESCTRRFATIAALMQHLEGAVSCKTRASRLATAVLPLSVYVDHQYVAAVVNTSFDCANVRSSLPHLMRGERGEAERKTAAHSCKFASEGSWNGSSYECVLCHETFMGLLVLNRHLRDQHLPAVQRQGSGRGKKVYRCKHANGSRACGKKFVDLGEMVKHVEDGLCGVKMFKKMMV